MMSLVAGLVLAAVGQDDPGAMYKEALFEEVDQGNLEKAIERYAKVIKADAAKNLKARALYRRGYCLEKLGKAKDAEQAYRDVIEQYPSEEETIKLARGRLAGVGDDSKSSFASNIQELILSLGANAEKREDAIRRLTLLGPSVLPEVKHALEHKDPTLAAGAARVLVNLEQYDGLYDVFMRCFEKHYENQGGDYACFEALLNARPEDRKRLADGLLKLSDDLVGDFVNSNVFSRKTPDSALHDALQDYIVTWRPWCFAVANTWAEYADSTQFLKFIERLTSDPKPAYDKIYSLLNNIYFKCVDDSNRKDVSRLLLQVFRDHPQTERVIHFPHYLDPQDQNSLYSAWLKSSDAKVRMSIADGIVSYGWFDLMFSVLTSEEHPDDVKTKFLGVLSNVDKTEAQHQSLEKYHLRFLKGLDAKGRTDRNRVESAVRYLLSRLSDDSPDLGMVLDILIESGCHLRSDGLISYGPKTETRRSHLIAEALKLVSSSDKEKQRIAVEYLYALGTATERLELIDALPKLGDKDTYATARDGILTAIGRLTSEERTQAMPKIKPLFASLKGTARSSLFDKLSWTGDPALSEIMQAALNDADATVRYYAVGYWSVAKQKESVGYLVQAMKDKARQVQERAIRCLGQLNSLEAVPTLIELVRSEDNTVREASRQALTQIRRYYEEQDEWQRWYDEVKRRHGK